jgi:hypothetical protein
MRKARLKTDIYFASLAGFWLEWLAIAENPMLLSNSSLEFPY